MFIGALNEKWSPSTMPSKIGTAIPNTRFVTEPEMRPLLVSTQAPPDREPVRWTPSPRITVAWTVVGSVLAAFGVGLFASLYAMADGGSASFSLGVADLPPLLTGWVAAIVVVFVAHELLHGLVVRGYGARPRFGMRLAARVMPALYTTAPGARFSRSQYISIALAPLVVVSVVGALLVAAAPFGGMLVVPLGTHVGGCVADLWLAALTLRQPDGTQIEDHLDGVFFHLPQTPAHN